MVLEQALQRQGLGALARAEAGVGVDAAAGLEMLDDQRGVADQAALVADVGQLALGRLAQARAGLDRVGNVGEPQPGLELQAERADVAAPQVGELHHDDRGHRRIGDHGAGDHRDRGRRIGRHIRHAVVRSASSCGAHHDAGGRSGPGGIARAEPKSRDSPRAAGSGRRARNSRAGGR